MYIARGNNFQVIKCWILSSIKSRYWLHLVPKTRTTCREGRLQKLQSGTENSVVVYHNSTSHETINWYRMLLGWITVVKVVSGMFTIALEMILLTIQSLVKLSHCSNGLNNNYSLTNLHPAHCYSRLIWDVQCLQYAYEFFIWFITSNFNVNSDVALRALYSPPTSTK